jgi:cytoskeletal protein RodZ
MARTPHKSETDSRPKLPLREHRQRGGVSLESIVDSTKLSRRFLEAIEGGEYADLPGGVFAISYIRQYAAAVGYDADVILEHHREWLGGTQQQEGADQRRQPGVRWGKFVLFG